MPKKYTRKNKRERRHRKTQYYKRGGDAAAAYILVECFPDKKAKEIFALNPVEPETKLKGKYLFKVINITKSNETDQIPIKETGIFHKQLSLGDVSNIKFKGQIVPSKHIVIKTGKLQYDPKPVDIEFKFSKNFKQIDLETPATGMVENIKYSLSSGTFTSKKSLKYIPRDADMFNAKINTNFLKAFPNKTLEKEKEQKED